ncbi:MAG: esterase [Pseudomonadota bacterium]
MNDESEKAANSAANIWDWVRDYFGIARRGRRNPVIDTDGLRLFIETRSSHVAQTSLYGYIRTRAGTRFPELFENDTFIESLNIAKWQIWLACVGDLSVYAGGLIASRAGASQEQVSALMTSIVDDILERTGTPDDSGEKFGKGAAHVRGRIADMEWAAVTDDETPFSESPEALIEWAPIVDDLKQYDTEIVMNSARFRWHEVRRDLRRDLDAEAVLNSAPPGGAGQPDDAPTD